MLKILLRLHMVWGRLFVDHLWTTQTRHHCAQHIASLEKIVDHRTCSTLALLFGYLGSKEYKEATFSRNMIFYVQFFYFA